MSVGDRAQALAHRRESLRLRAAAQRAELTYVAGTIKQRLGRIDHTLNSIRRVARKPLLLGVGAALLALIGPRRLLRWGTRSALAATTVSRVVKALR